MNVPFLSPPNKPYTTHRLLFGTHTSGQAQDYLQIATVHLPKRDEVALDREDYDDERGGKSLYDAYAFVGHIFVFVLYS